MWSIGQTFPNVFDIIDMNWLKTININKSDALKSTSVYISMSELAKRYAVLIDIQGYGYSGRLKYLLWSHRPMLLVNRPHKEFFYDNLVAWEHYIPVKEDLSDLVEQTQWCLNNYEKAKEIAENAFQFCQKYLTRDACYKRWNEIIEKKC